MLLLLVRYQLKQPTESTQEEEQVTRVELRASFRQICYCPLLGARQECPRVSYTCDELLMLQNTKSDNLCRQGARL